MANFAFEFKTKQVDAINSMRNIIIVLLAIVSVSIISCSRSSSRNRQIINKAERIMETSPDSALAVLDAVESPELLPDSLRAQYYLLVANIHFKQNRSMIADSLIGSAHEYYKGKEPEYDIKSGTFFAWYKFWVGDTHGAITLLDSIAGLNNLPDSLLAIPLRVRTLLGASNYEGESLIPVAKRLISVEVDTLRRSEAQYMLNLAYLYAGKTDSAIMVIDKLIDYTKNRNNKGKQFQFMYEKAGALCERGDYSESNKLIDSLFIDDKRCNLGVEHYLYLQKAMNYLNAGDATLSELMLEKADSCAYNLSEAEDNYYSSFSRLIKTMLEFRHSNRLELRHIAQITNRQKEKINRIEASQWETEKSALQMQNRALELKAENQRKTAIIIIVVLVAVLIAILASGNIKKRKRLVIEAEERAESLRRMVEEMQKPSSSDKDDILRRSLLQQFGIIKMVAETPTEENKEMLRKLSSINGDTNGTLVNWKNVYEIIDNLYSNTYTNLHSKYGAILTEKEEQVIMLMLTGFSAKEIGVITNQSTASVYVRKSTVKKKLEVPEGDDVIAFIRQELAH